MKYLVLYKSISGFTKKYAKWIADEMKAEIYPLKKIRKLELNKYDKIIFGGSLHAVGINGIKKLKKYFSIIDLNYLYIFAIGASPNQENLLTEIIENNFSAQEISKIKFYYFRGGFNFSKLNLSNKILMILLRVKLSFKKNKNDDEKGMMAAFKQPVDFTKEEYISDLINVLKLSKT